MDDNNLSTCYKVIHFITASPLRGKQTNIHGDSEELAFHGSSGITVSKVKTAVCLSWGLLVELIRTQTLSC